MLPFNLSGVDELPFERRYYLTPERGELICWFIQDNERVQMEGKPNPDYLKLREESIMLLRK